MMCCTGGSCGRTSAAWTGGDDERVSGSVME
jgi:hypothetical protein